MRQLLTTGLLWFSAIGCGLLGGVYFAFSAFIMTALARIAPPAGIAAMNAINVEIVQSLFMPVFMGTTLAAAVLAGLAISRWSEPGAIVMLVGGLLYIVGMFGVTAMFNVPLNNALAAIDPSSAEGASFWFRFVQDWTFWNHVRTVVSVAACTLFTVAIAAR